MDQSKLLQLVKKDLEELKDLTNELTVSESISKIEIEIALSKSKLIYQELELLKEMNLSDVETEKPFIKEAKKEEKPVNISEAKVVVEVEPEVTEQPNETPTEILVEDEPNLNGEVKHEPNEVINESNLEVEEEIKVEKKIEDIAEDSSQNNEIKEEEEPSIVLGETFAAGKSINETASENQTLDQKIASSPINRLEPAIGLNDRFLFMRELFEGNSDNYNHAIKEIDQMNNLKEAVDYLSINYKWKKTEASLKFVELVKRRFQS